MHITLPEELYNAVCTRIKKDNCRNLSVKIQGFEIAEKIQELLELYASDHLFTLDDLPSELREQVISDALHSNKSRNRRRALRARLAADALLLSHFVQPDERSQLITQLNKQLQK